MSLGADSVRLRRWWCLICRGFSISPRVLRVDAEHRECGRRGDERHAAALFVMPRDSVIALGADLLDQALVEQALEHVARGIALEPGGDGKDTAVGALAGSGENDELRIGQLRHGFAPCVREPRPSRPCYHPEPRRPEPDGATAERGRSDGIAALFGRQAKSISRSCRGFLTGRMIIE